VEEIQPLFSDNYEIALSSVKKIDSQEEFGKYSYNPATLH
jgi:hypothetical protein